MSEEAYKSTLKQNKLPINEEIVNLRKVISLIVSNRYLFIMALVVSTALAYLYNTLTIPAFKVSATVLIEQDKKASSSGNDQLLEGFGLMPGMRNLDNQVMVLSSRTLVNRTLDELDFDTEFYYRGLMKTKSIYPIIPISVISESGTQLPKDVEFSFKYLGNKNFRLDAESNDSFEIHKKASFGEKIESMVGSFIIESKDDEWLMENGSKKFYFLFHSRRKLVSDFTNALKIEPATKKGSIVKISLEGTNKAKDLAFLEKLTSIFLNISLDKKNEEAIRTIKFIDDQLIGISDSLLLSENRLQQFRSKNRVMNLSAQGQAIINQAMSLENEKARLGIEADYYDYLAEYLEKDTVGEVPIAPATVGIVDPGITKLVADLSDFQGRLYSKSIGDKNPMQSQLNQKIQNTKEALKETLRGVNRANNLAIKENQQQIKSINEQASVLPKTERELLGFERKYKLNDQLYTFLLEKRALAQIQKASNIADNEIIDYPEYANTPVSPKKPLIYLLALVVGIGFPFLWIFLWDLFSITIKDIEEINKITDIPIIGHIPHLILNKCTVVLDDHDSPVTEAYRILRTKLGFFTKEIMNPVILITSSMPNEGKTFTAINLASAYSLLGKKTVLVEFDLRRPKIFSEFNLDNEHGISTWLIGKDNLEDAIKETKHVNLHILTSGPAPPNPAELTSLGKTDELLMLLKKNYDFIIIDSAPIGMVSDTFHLVSLADTSIIVVRQKITLKDMFTNTVSDLKLNKIKNLSIVVNDIITGDLSYGYRGKYNYTYKNEKNKKLRARSIRSSKVAITLSKIFSGNSKKR
jgi:tyrosine-protein kinase Etk/Wzc